MLISMSWAWNCARRHLRQQWQVTTPSLSSRLPPPSSKKWYTVLLLTDALLYCSALDRISDCHVVSNFWTVVDVCMPRRWRIIISTNGFILSLETIASYWAFCVWLLWLVKYSFLWAAFLVVLESCFGGMLPVPCRLRWLYSIGAMCTCVLRGRACLLKRQGRRKAPKNSWQRLLIGPIGTTSWQGKSTRKLWKSNQTSTRYALHEYGCLVLLSKGICGTPVYLLEVSILDSRQSLLFWSNFGRELFSNKRKSRGKKWVFPNGSREKVEKKGPIFREVNFYQYFLPIFAIDNVNLLSEVFQHTRKWTGESVTRVACLSWRMQKEKAGWAL